MSRRMTRNLYRHVKDAWAKMPRPDKSRVDRRTVVHDNKVVAQMTTPTDRAMIAGVLRRLSDAELRKLQRR